MSFYIYFIANSQNVNVFSASYKSPHGKNGLGYMFETHEGTAKTQTH